MRFKKTIKRISALGVGATMVGATIFGAMAADLSNYPNQYIADGKFTGVLVVGDKAAAEDVIGVSDIAVSLQFAATTPAAAAGSTVSASGDAWKVGTSTKMLEMSEGLTNTETLRNITTYIDDSDLDVLASGTVSNSKGDAPYNQYLYLLGPGTGVSSGFVFYEEDDQDVTGDFLYFKSGDEIGRYLLEFTTALESDVDDSAGAADTTGLYLTDIEDVDMTMFGKDYQIVQARRTSSSGNNVKLILMGGAVKDTVLEGTTKTYTLDGKDYELTLDYVSATQAKFTVNGETSRLLLDGETDKLSDGTTIGVSEVLYQAYAGGVHSSTFFLGAQKVELKDTDITNVDSNSGNLKIDDNAIAGATVIIEGTDDNTTFKINRIHVNMTADDDFYVPANGKLSENPELDEPEVLFTSNWDVEYRGLSDQPIEEVKIKTSGNKKYNLVFLDGDGKEVSLPLAEAVAASQLQFGEKDKALINRENQTITKNDYVILSDGTENRGDRKTYILQYKSADKTDPDGAQQLKFKNLGGDDITQDWTVATSLETRTGDVGGKIATLRIGGSDYLVYNASSIKSNDFGILIDQDADGKVAYSNSNSAGVPKLANNSNALNITTWSGMEIGIMNYTSNAVTVTFKTPDNTREGGSTEDFVETLQATDLVFTVTADTNTKVDLTDGGNVALKTPEGVTDVQYGYTTYGTFIKYENPASDPDALTLEYPKAQREALVYVTSSGTTFSSTAGAAAGGGAVTVQRIDVGATKLASEVADINAVNSILIGGPCANAAAATVMGTGADCAAGFTPGVGKLQIYDVGTGNVAMVVAGYAAADTRNAAAVVANYGDYSLSGAAMEVTKVGSTLTVAEPSVASAEEETTDDAAAE